MLCPGLGERTRPGDIGRRIVQTIAAPFIDNDRDLSVTCSVGIAVTSDPATAAEQMICDADMAMFESKKTGRNRYHVHRP